MPALDHAVDLIEVLKAFEQLQKENAKLKRQLEKAAEIFSHVEQTFCPNKFGLEDCRSVGSEIPCNFPNEDACKPCWLQALKEV